MAVFLGPLAVLAAGLLVFAAINGRPESWGWRLFLPFHVLVLVVIICQVKGWWPNWTELAKRAAAARAAAQDQAMTSTSSASVATAKRSPVADTRREEPELWVMWLVVASVGAAIAMVGFVLRSLANANPDAGPNGGVTTAVMVVGAIISVAGLYMAYRERRSSR